MRFHLPIRTILRTLIIVLFAQAISASAQENDANRELAQAARTVLKTHCYSCHGVEYKVPRLDMLNHQVLTTPQPDEETSYITPGNLGKSEVWSRMGIQQDMPPESVKKRPSKEDIETIKKWIEAGAPEPTDASRELVQEKDVLNQIRAHLQALPIQDQKHQRYLTLTNLHNTSSVTNADMRIYRAAFSKLLNSLSRRGSMVVPKLIDEDQVVFNIDLRKLGWNSEIWQQAIQGYPYGIRWRDDTMKQVDDDINRMLGGNIAGDGISSVRVDWFIHTASRAPAYDVLIGLPDTIDELETRIGVDIKSDFRNGELMRAGFAGSGVSRNNRLVDRHEGSNTRYYYRSYDFGGNFGRSVLSRFPLGPKFEGNNFDDFAFEHDGGEVIFSMANGMQGYMLIDKEGAKLAEAPIKIVRDVTEGSGSPVIANAISCMGCHKRGIIDYEDAIQAARVLQGDQLTKLVSIYAKKDDLVENLRTDRRHFVSALDRAMGDFLIEGEDYGENLPIKRIEDMPEPISTVGRWYDKDIGAIEVAAELNLKSADFFKAAVATNDKLRQLGIGPLGDGAKIPRGMWDTQDESSSTVFQRVFVALGLGTGVAPIAPQ